jgi:hypothetical protein
VQRIADESLCREELGRAGAGYNEMVTSLPAAANFTAGVAKSLPDTGNYTGAEGRPNPVHQGRAVPHNFATLQLGTGDSWIIVGDGFDARSHLRWWRAR